ncbi:MAG: GNAT family N-acetyltransferase [Patescibacteria group bacterium]|nr:GNAT family N-acetyltransferase [Patescibacteria group bacterium]
MSTITIALAAKTEVQDIARIHKEEIQTGFLSSLPLAFLQTLYEQIIASDSAFCVIATKEDKVVGFVAGVTNLRSFYLYFLFHALFSAVYILVPTIFSLHRIKNMFESVAYPAKTHDLPTAELLTIAVRKEFQGTGVANKMLKVFIQEMRGKGVKVFKVLVGEMLTPAIKFYEKSGFEYVTHMNVHGDKRSLIYVYSIK